jgi:hypothetical protein
VASDLLRPLSDLSRDEAWFYRIDSARCPDCNGEPLALIRANRHAAYRSHRCNRFVCSSGHVFNILHGQAVRVPESESR